MSGNGAGMDRRINKTRRAIFAAFETLLTEKRYEQITVQDIIEKTIAKYKEAYELLTGKKFA